MLRFTDITQSITVNYVSDLQVRMQEVTKHSKITECLLVSTKGFLVISLGYVSLFHVAKNEWVDALRHSTPLGIHI